MINNITSNLLNIKPSVPREFSRKPREIQGFLQWKATELRLFLVYLGPFVLQNVLASDCYTNFMSLNVAMIILLSPSKGDFTEYAQQLLEYFVKTFDKIYGNYNVSHNVHGLLHLISDYNNFGPLDQSSCYPFENFIKVLKSSLRKHEKPLQQLIRRYDEQCKFPKENISDKYNSENNYIFKKLHYDGPLPNDTFGSQYHQLHFGNFMINTKVDRDSYLLTACGKIMKCVNFVNRVVNSKLVSSIVGKYFIDKMPAYTVPISSTLLNIYKIDNLSNNLIVLDVTTVQHKIMVINVNNETIALPILHSDLK